jgi:hypothetical protein
MALRKRLQIPLFFRPKEHLAMRRVLLLIGVLTALALPASAFALFDLKITDHGTTCFVTSDRTAVECTGKLSGLGSTTTNIEVLAGFTCTNKAGNTVVGQSGGQSGPIQPQNGQVTFDVTTASVADKCTRADDHTATFGPTATINVFQNGELVFTEQVAIRQ